MKLRTVFDIDTALKALDAIDPKTNLPLYKFKGNVRMAIARKMRGVKAPIEDYTAARKRIEAEVGVKPEDQKNRTEKWLAYDAKLGELLDEEITLDLGTALTKADLDLDHNEVPSMVLLMLGPAFEGL